MLYKNHASNECKSLQIYDLYSLHHLFCAFGHKEAKLMFYLFCKPFPKDLTNRQNETCGSKVRKKQNVMKKLTRFPLCFLGPGWIRTSEGNCQRIYNPSLLTAQEPTLFIYLLFLVYTKTSLYTRIRYICSSSSRDT